MVFLLNVSLGLSLFLRTYLWKYLRVQNLNRNFIEHNRVENNDLTGSFEF